MHGQGLEGRGDAEWLWLWMDGWEGKIASSALVSSF
jgi:hypothetical protein